MKVSVIVPVYNTELYISRCIESCLNQTLDDIEIILVDDYSKDNSREIILEYSKKYPSKIRYIFQTTNQRQGAARNRGMEIAKGEYFIFVDSDDWIEPDMCEVLYNKAVDTDSDMVGSHYYKSWDDRHEENRVNLKENMYGDMDYCKKNLYTKNYGMFWTRIYKAEFLKNAKLNFPENIFYEDACFNFYSVLYANKIEMVDRYFYHYYQGNQSTVRNRNNPHQYERIRLAEYILNYIKERQNLKQYERIVNFKYLNMQASNLIYTCLGQFDKPDTTKISEICKGIKNRSLFGSEVFSELPHEFRFFLKLANFSPALCVLCYKWGIYWKFELIKKKIFSNYWHFLVKVLLFLWKIKPFPILGGVKNEICYSKKLRRVK